jgi:hypothetical protein
LNEKGCGVVAQIVKDSGDQRSFPVDFLHLVPTDKSSATNMKDFCEYFFAKVSDFEERFWNHLTRFQQVAKLYQDCKDFLLCSLACSQIWLIHLVDDHQFGCITKLKKTIKKTPKWGSTKRIKLNE